MPTIQSKCKWSQGKLLHVTIIKVSGGKEFKDNLLQPFIFKEEEIQAQRYVIVMKQSRFQCCRTKSNPNLTVY